MTYGEPEETGGLRLYPKDILNHLLLVWACDYIAHSPTTFTKPDKPSDVIVVDVVDLDLVDERGQAGLLAPRCWWRQAQLIMSLRGRIGKPEPLLVRMGKGAGTMGRQAPFQLVSATADGPSVQRADAWRRAHPEFVPGSPQPAAPAPATDYQQPQSHWTAPESSYMGQPPQQTLPPAAPPGKQETVLERMARLAGMPQNHHGDPQSDTPPY